MFIFLIYFLIGGKTLGNFVMVSAVQQLWQISRDYACTTSLLSLPEIFMDVTQFKGLYNWGKSYEISRSNVFDI